MKITRATVLVRSFHHDLVILGTDLPSPMPNVSKAPLTLDFKVVAGEGKKYVEEHFPNLDEFQVIELGG